MQGIHICLVFLGLLQLHQAHPPLISISPDGTYKFSFHTGSGYQAQQKSSDGSVSGGYGFSGQGGSKVDVKYSSGGGGSGFSSGSLPTSYSAPPSSGGGMGSYVLSLNPGGVYSYEYQLSDQSKSESRAADGKVKGRFSFKGKDGQEKSLSYTADEGGFQPMGAHLPKADPAGAAGMSIAPSYGGLGGLGGGGMVNLNLQPGGIYSYDFTLPDQSKSESRGADGKVKGQFRYKGKDGQEKSVSYTADEGGFQPVGAHLPKDDPAGAPPAAGPVGASPFAPSYGGPAGGAGDSSYDLGLDGTYTYQYNLKDQAKSESRSSDGKVRGQFSYTDPQGQKKSLKYTADQEGFQPEGEHLPKAPEPSDPSSAAPGSGAAPSLGAPSGTPGAGGAYSFSYDTGDHAHSQSGGGGGAGAGAGLGGSGAGLGGAGSGGYSFSYDTGDHSHSQSGSPGAGSPSGAGAPSPAGAGGAPGSYSFSYDTGDHSHSQSGGSGSPALGAPSGSGAPSTGTGGAPGSYSFSYDTGDHSHSQSGGSGSPALGAPSGSGAPSTGTGGAPGSYSFSYDTGDHSHSQSGGGGGAAPSFPSPSGAGAPGGSGSLNLNLQPGGVYSYDFTLPDQAKSESRGADGKVKGKFSYKGKDGQEKSLSYTADEGGFQPVGAHLPKDDPTGAGAPLGASPYGGPSAPSFGGGGGPGSLSLDLQPGGVYSYGYSLPDQSKSESRGADGKVKGQFSFKGKDGQEKSVSYTADEGGFQPVGAHLPKDDPAGASPAAGPVGASPFAPSYGGPAGGAGDSSYDLGLDGTYTYQYNLKDQAKSESRSSDGKVRGQFSYTDPQGQKKSLKYTADQEGFQPEGEHLPKAPEPSDPSSAAPGSGAAPSLGAPTGSPGAGGAYSFSYDTGDHAHSQSGGGAGAGAGAGAGLGGSGAGLGGAGAGGYSFSYDTGDHSHSQSGGGGAAGSASSGTGGAGGGAGSFAFSYDTGDHSHSQSGNAGGDSGSAGSGAGLGAGGYGHSESQQGQGEVQGQYYVNAPSGSSQKVSYSAGKAGYNPIVSARASLGGGSSSLGSSSYSYSYKSASSSASSGHSVQGKYSVSGKGNTQKSSYSAGSGGFSPIHSITITL